MRPSLRPLAAWLGLPHRERWRWLKRKLREALPGADRIRSPDRVYLEETLLPGHAADPALRALVFVGCEWYTRHYEAMFDPDRSRFRTIDIDPRRARHGAARHIVAPLQELAAHLAPASVDVIVCNGVYGFGIYDRRELGRALLASHAVLRPGGTLILGWNDVPALAPFDPVGVALASGFARDPARGDAWRVRTDTPTRHTFDTYVRVDDASEPAATP
ncbi:MAG: hypothetical protein ABIQ33_09560 [Caldimonas sp.]